MIHFLKALAEEAGDKFSEIDSVDFVINDEGSLTVVGDMSDEEIERAREIKEQYPEVPIGWVLETGSEYISEYD